MRIQSFMFMNRTRVYNAPHKLIQGKLIGKHDHISNLKYSLTQAFSFSRANFWLTCSSGVTSITNSRRLRSTASLLSAWKARSSYEGKRKDRSPELELLFTLHIDINFFQFGLGANVDFGLQVATRSHVLSLVLFVSRLTLLPENEN